MTTLLQKAFSEAAKLPPAEQDVIAEWLLTELAEEDEFDRVIAETAGKLAGMAKDAIEEHCAGRTQELDPDRL